MWKTLLTNLTSLAGGIYIYLIVAGLSGVVAGYGAYSWTSDYYIAKIEKSNLEAEQKVNDIQQQGDRLVADYVKQVEQLGSVISNKFLVRYVLITTVLVLFLMLMLGCTTQVQLVKPQPPAALMEPPPPLTLLPSSASQLKTTPNTSK